jgi:hypothetical protein
MKLRPLFSRPEVFTMLACLAGILVLLLCAGCGQSETVREVEQGAMLIQGNVAGHPVLLQVEAQRETNGTSVVKTTAPPFLTALLNSAAQAAGSGASTALGAGGLLSGLLAAALAVWKAKQASQANEALKETTAAVEHWKQDEEIPAGAKMGLLNELSKSMSQKTKKQIRKLKQAGPA